MFASPATPALPCDIAIVLALDVSGSVDPDEYRLQSEGLSAALGDPVIAEALVSANALVAVLQWSGEPHQAVSVPWTGIASHGDVADLRAEVDAAPRIFRNYSTGIGEALFVAVDLLAEAPVACRRRVIDVSGDGASNEGRGPRAARPRLDSDGIVVNGLAIEGSEDGIAAYYRENVIHGPGAFLEVARGFEDFPRAIRRKLSMELADRLAGLE